MPLRIETFPVVFAGTRIHFFDGFESDRRGRAHQAIDISSSRGTPVVCSVEGTVIRSWTARRNRTTVTGCGWSDAGGNVIVVLDRSGYVHYFAHLNQTPLVRAGEQVQPGTALGQIGNTGSIAAGSHPHLHYQVWMVGSGRESETAAGVFTRPFGAAINPYSELVRTARAVGAAVGRTGGVFIRAAADEADE